MELIDIHTHGLAGTDTRSTGPEDYLRLAEAYLEHGTGAFVPTLFPAPVDIMRAELAAIKKAMDTGGPGARILGANLEGPFVNPRYCGALDKSIFLVPDTDALARLLDGFHDVVRIITVAPELPGALKLIEAASEKGVIVSMGHSAATFAEAAEGKRAGASCVTHIFNAMTPVHHREPGLAGCALLDDGLYVEVIADLVHLRPETIKLILKCKPPERIILVSDSLGPAKTPAVSEGGPVYMDDEMTLAGSGITLEDAVANLVLTGADETAARSFASENPARLLGAG